METIYVLIETEPGSLENILNEIVKTRGVVEASAVTGPFDIIVKVQSNTIPEALGIVVKEIRKIQGIRSTETLVSVKV